MTGRTHHFHSWFWFIHSFSSNCFILDKVAMDLEPNTDTRWEYTLEEKPVHHRTPYTHTHRWGNLYSPMHKPAGGSQRTWRIPNPDTGRTSVQNSTQTATQVQDWASDPGAVMRQYVATCYTRFRMIFFKRNNWIICLVGEWRLTKYMHQTWDPNLY